MGVLIFPRSAGIDILTAMIGAVPYSTAKLHLFSNNIVPTANSVIADFTPPVYSGYAPKAVTWSTPFIDTNQVAVSSSGELLYAQAGVVGDVVYGAYLTDTAGTGLLAAGVIDDGPFNFVNNGDVLPLLTKLDSTGGLLSVSPVP